MIDVHCHPRWIGHNGAKMIENMDASGIEKAWLLSWELPEREMSPGYYATLNPTGVGIPFRDVVDVAERYPDRFIPGTTVDFPEPVGAIKSTRARSPWTASRSAISISKTGNFTPQDFP